MIKHLTRHLTPARRAMFFAAFTCVCAMALGFASFSSAAITFDAKDFTEPLETQVSTALPIVIGFIAAIFGIRWLIRNIPAMARSAK